MLDSIHPDAILELAPVGVAAIDADGVVLEANRRLCALVGKAAHDIIGRRIRDTIPGCICGEPGAPARMTLAIMDASGAIRTVVADTLRMDVEGARVAACFFTDITDCEAAVCGCEETLDTLQTELRRRKETEKLREDVERIMRHDLKNPLTAIKGFADILLLSVEDQAARRRAGLIKEAAQSMLFMIDHSLDLLRMEFGTYTLASERIDLSDIALAAAQDLEHLLGKSDAALKLLGPSAPLAGGEHLYVLGEAEYLRKMLVNLIRNAIEASGEGDTVTVLLDRDGPRYQILVHNPGLVPDEAASRMFQKYNSRDKAGGTGLGVYSARLIALTHGGDLAFTSTPGDGTRFTVTLPAD